MSVAKEEERLGKSLVLEETIWALSAKRALLTKSSGRNSISALWADCFPGASVFILESLSRAERLFLSPCLGSGAGVACTVEKKLSWLAKIS